MKRLKKVWVRIFVSLLIGSIVSEIIHIQKGYMPIRVSNFIVMSIAIFSFLVITIILRLRKKKEDDHLKSKEDILDA